MSTAPISNVRTSPRAKALLAITFVAWLSCGGLSLFLGRPGAAEKALQARLDDNQRRIRAVEMHEVPAWKPTSRFATLQVQQQQYISEINTLSSEAQGIVSELGSV